MFKIFVYVGFLHILIFFNEKRCKGMSHIMQALDARKYSQQSTFLSLVFREGDMFEELTESGTLSGMALYFCTFY